MFGRESKQRIDTLIGRSARIGGDVEFTGSLYVEGYVSGSVRAPEGSASSLTVSEHGCIEGSIEAENVMLDGVVQGGVRASGRLVLGPKARIQGDVCYGSIEITLGAQISGRLMPLTPQGEGGAEAVPA